MEQNKQGIPDKIQLMREWLAAEIVRTSKIAEPYAYHQYDAYATTFSTFNYMFPEDETDEVTKEVWDAVAPKLMEQAPKPILDIDLLAEAFAKKHSIYESAQDDTAYGFKNGYNQCLQDKAAESNDAIEFAEWADKNGWKRTSFNTWYNHSWNKSLETLNKKAISTQELYLAFKVRH